MNSRRCDKESRVWSDGRKGPPVKEYREADSLEASGRNAILPTL